MLAINIATMVYHVWPLLLQGLLTTIKITLGAVAIGFIGGTLVGIAACKRFKNIFSPIIAGYVLIIRGTPVYLQVLMVYYALPELLGINLSPAQAGILALGCCSIAYVTEMVRGGINAVPLGQWYAAAVLGYSTWQTLVYIIMPQALKTILPALVNEIVSVLKDSSVLSAIGLVELTKVAMNMSARTLDPMSAYVMIALLYLLITTVITFLAKIIEKKLEVGS